ncbi:unnamed protein product [Taenia asiatica]|uniref:Uncharacterized protein n=1 Tax=Taenia asiatica TaxID=60517 RepID=A0A0R3VV87_TAEAS|nr:unnamed protein product [Taenia asiatica]
MLDFIELGSVRCVVLSDAQTLSSGLSLSFSAASLCTDNCQLPPQAPRQSFPQQEERNATTRVQNAAHEAVTAHALQRDSPR